MFSISRIPALIIIIYTQNGNPLQCSCLENPRDGGAWWAAVYGVTQSRTRLKRLSSSSCYPASREGSGPCTCVLSRFSHARLCDPISHQAPLSMGFSRQEYCGGLPCSPPGHLPHPGVRRASVGPLQWPTGSLPLVLPGKPCQARICTQ